MRQTGLNHLHAAVETAPTGGAGATASPRPGHRRSVLGRFARVAAISVAFAAASTAAMAQEALKLKYAQVLPSTHYIWEEGVKGFTEAVTAATNGQVTFEVYPAGQLGKDKISVLQSGLADLVLIIPSYTPDKMPMSSVSELPGFYSSSCEGSDMFWEISKPGGMLYEQELKGLGIHPLFANILIPYRILTSKKQVVTIDDMAGLKIRANGAAMDKTVRALGGVPVRASSPELYDAVSRGTLDGALFTLNALEQYSLEKVIDYVVDGPQLGSASIIIGMSEKRWNGLPDNVKTAMTDAAATAQKTLCAWMDNDEKQVVDKFVAAGTITPTALSAEQLEIWQKRVSSVAEDWAKEVDAAGKQGSELLKAFRAVGSSQ